jgi:hypothetical protein
MIGARPPVWGFLADSNPLKRFEALLSESGLDIKQHVMDTIVRTPSLQGGLQYCRNVGDAMHIYELAETVLRTATKVAAQEQGVFIDGLMRVNGIQSALFFYTFRNNIPHLFKVPVKKRAAQLESRLWQELKDFAGNEALVPVSFLEVGGTHSSFSIMGHL